MQSYIPACSREIHNSFEFKAFHSAKPFYTEDGTLELLVRFKGVADGHVALTVNKNTTEPLYMVGKVYNFNIKKWIFGFGDFTILHASHSHAHM